jgi:hypothetical protein
MRSKGGIANGVAHACNKGFSAFGSAFAAVALRRIAVAGLDFRFVVGFFFVIADAFSYAPGGVLMGSGGGFVEMLEEAAGDTERRLIPARAAERLTVSRETFHCSVPRRREGGVAHA